MEIRSREIYNLIDIFEQFEPKSTVNFQVMSQELYDVDLTKYEITGILDEYRYFEELFDINIIIIDKLNNVILPKHKKPYFWDYNEKRSTIIIRQLKVKQYYSYELLQRNPKEYIEQKLNITRRSTYDKDITYISQHIDFNGKLRMLKTDTEWIHTIGAPLHIPIEFAMNPHIKDIMDISNKFYESLNLKKEEIIRESSNQNYYIHRYTSSDNNELF